MLAKRTVQIWLALGAVWIVWSSTYLAIRVVVETLPPLLSAATRWAVAGSALYLIVFGSLIGFTCYVWTFRNVPTSLATTYAYVNPLIAVILGALLLDERITATTVAGGLVIVLAVAIIVTATSGGVKTDEEVEHADLATNEVIA